MEVKIAAWIKNANKPATKSSDKIPKPPGNFSNLFIGPNFVISKNLNKKNDNNKDIKI